jgi:CRISPR-associated endonuclease Csn1
VRGDAESAVKTPLTKLVLDDLKHIVGYERDTGLIQAIRERLEAFGGDGKKAFGPGQPPLRKPSRPDRVAPEIRSVQLKGTQKSGISVRGGIANNGAIMRVDLFTKGGKFYPVPIYVSDVVKPELPNRAVVAYKPESEWTLIDGTYGFLFSLHANDWVRVVLRDREVVGYFSGLDRATGAISIWAHDRDTRRTKNGQWTGVGVKTAKSVQKFHVDYLGRLHLVKSETQRNLKDQREG